MALPFESTGQGNTVARLTFRQVVAGGDELEHVLVHLDVVLLLRLVSVRTSLEGDLDLPCEEVLIQCRNHLQTQTVINEWQFIR